LITNRKSHKSFQTKQKSYRP